jgi:hypothetical protein
MKVNLLENYITKYTAEDYNLTKVLKPLKLNWEKGPWLAGGSLRRLVMNEPISTGDIDVYFANGRQLENTIKRLGGEINKLHRNRFKNSYIFEYENNKYNLIFKEFYKYPGSVLDDFDFTVCQFISDGITLGFEEFTLEHCKDKAIVRAGTKLLYHARVAKYISKGFHPWQDNHVRDVFFDTIKGLLHLSERGVATDDLLTQLGLAREDIIY